MKLIDITRTVQNAPVYPGSKPPVIARLTDMKKGDMYNSSLITADSHAGTHCDAPRHFFEDGTGIGEMDLALFYGPCRVITFQSDSLISAENLDIADAERIALHGGYLAVSGAEYLAKCGLKAVVTDSLSIAPPDNEAEIHKIILGAGIAVIENAVLDGVPDGDYTLCAFPVKLSGSDGAPVRAVLIDYS